MYPRTSAEQRQNILDKYLCAGSIKFIHCDNLHWVKRSLLKTHRAKKKQLIKRHDKARTIFFAFIQNHNQIVNFPLFGGGWCMASYTQLCWDLINIRKLLKDSLKVHFYFPHIVNLCRIIYVYILVYYIQCAMTVRRWRVRAKRGAAAWWIYNVMQFDDHRKVEKYN